MEIVAKRSAQFCQEGQHYQLENSSCESVYDSIFTWKISKLNQKKLAAEKVLYSSPFYTGQNTTGYKLCLLLYMDGDGSGRSTHLSFFLTLMRGEYDAMLKWPFEAKITLVLEDQELKQHNIVKWFKTGLNTSVVECVQRPSPYSEINAAFGCCRFAPLSVLDNLLYVKDDTMTLKCIINTKEM